ncbi:DUF4186 domain-containing protein [Sphingobium jiangsuense]|uniref:DUF4186 domain-containing protein n=1 Tax=Sphingobium jiangsuense TaxID=870476 RepID=A0A7W6FNC0_9SPHN|nr:DUF4186 domain-containing protein [Sphingobium jiangsuense]MBB3924658.1 hypothetical protein [Sphingobium jiangsuense]GLT01456.1 DUF4186 domain-containing protein [Sphingobium jiangsuense]
MASPPDDLWASLARSPFRSRFRLGPKERACYRDKGAERISSHAADFIAKRLAPAHPAKDGRQTPMRGHPVFIAQHATATCCRTCLRKWHGIAEGRPLGPEEQERIVAIIMEWLDRQQGAPDPRG